MKIASGLCAAEDVAILLREGGVLRVAAHDGTITHSQLNAETPVERGYVGGRTVVDRQPIQVSDLTVAGKEFPRGREIALRLGVRTSLGIPLLREDVAIGCLLLRRKVVRPFNEKQIALPQTFADQAVIAIENTRLFEEVQTRTKELQESLDRQTATSEVLGVISRTPNEEQPVLDTIVAAAQRLCQAERAAVWRLEGETLRTADHAVIAIENTRLFEEVQARTRELSVLRAPRSRAHGHPASRARRL